MMNAVIWMQVFIKNVKKALHLINGSLEKDLDTIKQLNNRQKNILYIGIKL